MTTDEWYADLYRRRYRALVIMALTVAGSLTEAEEGVQEAFERGYARRSRLAGMENAEAWLYTVAVNVVRRRHRRRALAGRLYPQPPDPPAADVTVGTVDLYRALHLLSPSAREVIVLHHLAELPVEEVAHRLGVPVGTVKSRLARGREALAGLLSPDADQPTRTSRTPTQEVDRHG